jgi:hypothetical protein
MSSTCRTRCSSAWRGPLRDALKRPLCCTLQGEDLFIEDLIEPYRAKAIDLIPEGKVVDVDRFIAVSDYYVAPMAQAAECRARSHRRRAARASI